MGALGIIRYAMLQLKEVSWRCSNMHMRRDALGRKTLVFMQLLEVTWKC